MIGLILRKRLPQYDPSTDAGLAMWLDAQDSSTSSLLNTVGGSITNGATIGTWKSKKGITRNFIQYGSQARPTWDSTGVSGLGAVRCNSQILKADTVTDLTGLSGHTVMVVGKRVGNGPVPGDEGSFQTTIAGGTPANGLSQIYISSEATREVGGRRINTNSFQGTVGDAISNGVPYILTAVFDYSNAKLDYYQDGVIRARAVTFQTAGTSGAAFGMGVGARPEGDNVTMGSISNCYVSEVLMWLTAMTPDQLIGAHTYLRLRWKIG